MYTHIHFLSQQRHQKTKQVHVNLKDKREEEYSAPPAPAYVAYSGEGKAAGYVCVCVLCIYLSPYLWCGVCHAVMRVYAVSAYVAHSGQGRGLRGVCLSCECTRLLTVQCRRDLHASSL
jgi:hypothetical protein